VIEEETSDLIMRTKSDITTITDLLKGSAMSSDCLVEMNISEMIGYSWLIPVGNSLPNMPNLKEISPPEGRVRDITQDILAFKGDAKYTDLLLCQYSACPKLAIKTCGRCKKVFYCCDDHRDMHWTEGHRSECKMPYDPDYDPIPGSTGLHDLFER
jgi:hypothetical protein